MSSPVYAKLAVPKVGSTVLQDLFTLPETRIECAYFSITAESMSMIFDRHLDVDLERPLGKLVLKAEKDGFVKITDDVSRRRAWCWLQSQRASAEGEAKSQLPSHGIELPLDPPKIAESVANGSAEPAEHATPVVRQKRNREAGQAIENVNAKKGKTGRVFEAYAVEDDGAMTLDNG